MGGGDKTSLATSDLDTHRDLAVHRFSVSTNKRDPASGACLLTIRLSAYHMPNKETCFRNHADN
jgi:hypothetical protein